MDTRRLRTLLPHRHPRERGQALVFIALLLAIIGGMTAVTVDVGSYSTDRRDLQNAADSIALAAAQALPNADAARSAANQWAIKNDIDPADMTVTIIPQNLPSEPNPKVRVRIDRDHDFTFARIIGIASAEVGATGAAIRTSPSGSPGLVPWSVTQPILNLVPPGQTTVLKYDSNNPASGNFGAIRIDGSGGSVYRDTIQYGSDNGLCATGVTGCPYPSTVTSETGNLVGPTRDAVNYVMNNTSTACDTWAEAAIVANGHTSLNPACNPFLAGGNPASLRVIVIPVVASLCNGACTLTIVDFALFFLEGYGNGGCNGNHCDIQGRFLNTNLNYGANVGVYNPNSLSHFVRLTE